MESDRFCAKCGARMTDATSKPELSKTKKRIAMVFASVWVITMLSFPVIWFHVLKNYFLAHMSGHLFYMLGYPCTALVGIIVILILKLISNRLADYFDKRSPKKHE